MDRRWRLFLALLWLGYIICGGIQLFSNGFLLSKIVQNERSSCDTLREPDVAEKSGNVNVTSAYCLERKSKVIVLLVDALKYEFGVYNESLDESEAAPFENKLKVIHDLLQNDPDRSRLYRFVADPPTTTLQRLKGLTTGTLPTFIDMGSNFATPEINEDNIIDQLKDNNRTIVFMGDSTWTELFPKRFTRQYPMESFNIFDLDTVDREIEKLFPKELQKRDWDLLIAHLLGVDHCGHKHGPSHPEMGRKLTEVNAFIEEVVGRMDNMTTLFVIGDHGMTDKGDHGGDSADETNALLFAYSKGVDFYSNVDPRDPKADSMQQIDFVPTLSAILGVPVPFSNLGTLNVNLLPDVPFSTWSKYQVMLQHLWHNAKQMHRYFEEYATNHAATFDEEALDNIDNKFLVLSYRVASIYTESAFQNFEHDLKVHMRSVLSLCRDVWVKFDAQNMSQGLLIVSITVFLLFLLVTNLSVRQLDEAFSGRTVQTIYLVNLGTIVFLYIGNTQLPVISGNFNALLVTCMLNVCILGFVVVQQWLCIVDRWSDEAQKTSRETYFTRIIYGVFIGVFFSNSFIVQEQKIVTYLLAGILCYQMYQLARKFNYSQGHKRNYRIVALVLLSAFTYCLFLLRMSYLYFRCREEQGDCMGGGGDREVSGFSRFLTTYLKLGTLCNKIDVTAIVSVAGFITVCRLYLQSCGNLMGYTFRVLVAKFGPTVMAICIGIHFLLANNKLAAVYQLQIDAMAWIVYGLFAVQVGVTAFSPLMVHLMERNSDGAATNNVSIPGLFQQLKGLFQRDGSNRTAIPVVYGLPTVYSSTLVNMFVFLTLVLALLLGANSANGLFISMAVATLFLIVQAVLKYNSSESIDQMLNPSFLSLVTWLLLAQFTFYATSHQPTLSQIDWHAAFVGRTYYHDHSAVISGLLVLTNTFNGVILYVLMCPALLIVPFLVYVKQPQLKDVFPRAHQNAAASKTGGKPKVTGDYKIETLRQNDDEDQAEVATFDVTRGELNLFENDRSLLVSLFRLGAKLIMLQGLRMFCSMLACTIHCRHLMVWKIFAPRFIYEGIATYIMIAMLLISYITFSHLHSRVVRLIAALSKVD